MRHNALSLKKFYTSPLGRASKKSILKVLNSFWEDFSHMRTLGFGYVIPYFDTLAISSRNTLFQLALPEALGGEHWLRSGKNASVLVDEENWPFPESFYDRILIIHGLEEAESINAMLKECYRALAPKGHLLVVAPNRNSIWSRSERTPFSSGHPFTKNQLEKRLNACGFSVERASHALFFPPLSLAGKAPENWEKLGQNFWPGFGGTLMMEASKDILAKTKRPYYRPVFIPVSS